MVQQSIWLPSIIAVLIGFIASPYFREVKVSCPPIPACPAAPGCFCASSNTDSGASKSAGSANTDMTNNNYRACLNNDDIDSLLVDSWQPEVGAFIDISGGANASVACANPLKYFASNQSLAKALHALTPKWRQIASNVTFRGWGWYASFPTLLRILLTSRYIRQ
jgi:hypothetical protein